MTAITLNEMLIDYITLTSYSDEFYRLAEELGNKINKDWVSRARMQYNGKLWTSKKGTYFLGDGEQAGKRHYILQVDGRLAHDMRYSLYGFHPAYFVRCTRIDLQITIEQPSEWSQWDLLLRFRDRFGEALVSYPKPAVERGVLLQTVYLGRREGSDRFLRVYVKLSKDNRKLLRLETELKRNRAPAVFRELAENQWDEDYVRIVQPELQLQSQKDKYLERLFYPYLNGQHKPIRVETSEGNTAKWIMDTCIPSMSNYLHSHTADYRTEIENGILKMAEFIVWRQHEN